MNIKNFVNYGMCIYESAVTGKDAFKLGDVVINEDNEIGVIIQMHTPNEFRTEMFGNTSTMEVRLATDEEIEKYRPNILNEAKFRNVPTIMALGEMAATGNKWAVIAINETGFYKASVIKKAKRIDGIYLVELDKPTCICSPAINYPAIRLKNFLHNTEGFTEDEVWEMETDQTLSDWTYYNEGYKADLIKYYKDETEEEVIEYEAANPSVC